MVLSAIVSARSSHQSSSASMNIDWSAVQSMFEEAERVRQQEEEKKLKRHLSAGSRSRCVSSSLSAASSHALDRSTLIPPHYTTRSSNSSNCGVTGHSLNVSNSEPISLDAMLHVDGNNTEERPLHDPHSAHRSTSASSWRGKYVQRQQQHQRVAKGSAAHFDEQVRALRLEVEQRIQNVVQLEEAIDMMHSTDEQHLTKAHPVSHVSERLYSTVSNNDSDNNTTQTGGQERPTRKLTKEQMEASAQRLSMHVAATSPASSMFDLKPIDRRVRTNITRPKNQRAEFTDNTAKRLAVDDPTLRREKTRNRIRDELQAARKYFAQLPQDEITAGCDRSYSAAKQWEERRVKAEQQVLEKIEKQRRYGGGGGGGEAGAVVDVPETVARLSKESDAARQKRLKMENEFAHGYKPIGSVTAAHVPESRLSNTFLHLYKDGADFTWRSSQS